MNKEHLHPDGRPYTKEEFVEKIKTDKEFAKRFGNLGKIYGHQWRNWNDNIDQISDLIKQLKENPDSRRLLLSAWNASDLPNQVLPPCHYGFQVYTRELDEKEGIKKDGLMVKYKGNDCKIISYHNANHELLILDTPEGERMIYENQLDEPIDYSKFPTRAISLMWNQRSVDTGLGLSFNIASYSLLLMMIAKQVNMVPDEVIGNLGDVHLYLNHIEPIKEQLTREPYPLPTVKISDRVVNDISEYTLDDIILENYQSHPTIKMPLSN